MSYKLIRTSLIFAAFLAMTALPALAASDHVSYITGPIKTGPEATKQCLECHDDAATDFMRTSHWNWGQEQVVHGKKVKLGKANAINNYCVAVAGNEIFCSTCHAGYGMESVSTFDFTDKTKIDCLVCHDTTGTYNKSPGTGGQPAPSIDLLKVAQKVGKPVRDNCGVCHFYGGGGDAVKHGDLDSSMSYPERKTDVHMASDGNNFQCQTCHETKNHQIPGNALGVSPAGKNHFGCERCHEAAPHKESRLNQHVASVACQTCHIPFYAREVPTKMSWDWSTAGEDLKPEVDKYGKDTYMKKKGSFTWGQMVQPEYAWYKDGAFDAYLVGEKIDPKKVTRLAGPTATIKDKDAKLYPFKVHRGKQVYDSKQNIFLTPKTFGPGGYWKDFDWDKAIRLGMEANPAMKAQGITFSGAYGFAPTEMWWKLNHMVSPKEQALTCLECHGDNSRMKWKELGFGGDPMTDKKAAAKK